MPIHSVIVINTSGNILYSKYFDHNILDSKDRDNSKLLFEQQLFQLTSKSWSVYTKSVFDCLGIHVAMNKIGELIVFVGGYDDIDEFTLADITKATEELLSKILKGSSREISFLEPESYRKWTLSIDEMLPQGIPELIDASTVLNLIKFKSL